MRYRFLCFLSAIAALMTLPSAEALAQAPQGTEEATASTGLMLLFAFLGGLILNIMPCVLPVLSIKVLGLVQQADSSRREILNHGIAYTVGVLASFAVLAGLVITLQASGKLVGWGFQLQSPLFVALLGTLTFGFGLSLFGVFEVGFSGAGALDQVAAGKHGYSGSFFSGIFATVLATPCTAPLLAPALGFAMAQPPVILFIFLLTIGFGLAFPFLLLAIFPTWAKWIPKPGAWMEIFKKTMGFLLMATTVWLVSVLMNQVSETSVISFLGFLLVVSIAAWVYGEWGGVMRESRVRWTALSIALLMTVGGGVWLLDFDPRQATSVAVAEGSDAIAWRDFFDTNVEERAAAGETVFIDFTASWCVSCKFFERTVIETDDIKAAFKKDCVLPVKADYTNEDDRITTWLKRFKRPGVPMYLIIPAGQPEKPIRLPDLLTKSALLEGLKKAGPSTSGKCAS
jgi:thiol:disulfide interchange protein